MNRGFASLMTTVQISPFRTVTLEVPDTRSPSPNRASYYVPSRDRALPQPQREDNPKLRDTQFPRSPQPSDIVFDVVARRDDRCFKPMPELKLRPILTKPPGRADAGAASDSSSAAASPTARVRLRFHERPLLPTADEDEACRQKSRRRRRRRRPRASRLRSWMYESLVVVKESADPLADFRRSMLQMIVEKEILGDAELRELLHRFLSLNSPHHHHLILRAFAEIWEEVFAGYERTPDFLAAHRRKKQQQHLAAAATTTRGA